jgi:hypothetical protein
MLLAALGASAQQYDEVPTVSPEIDSVSRTKVYAVLQNPAPNAVDVRQVALSEADEGNVDLRGSLRVDAVEPVLEWAVLSNISIFEDLI